MAAQACNLHRDALVAAVQALEVRIHAAVGDHQGEVRETCPALEVLVACLGSHKVPVAGV